VVGADGDQPFQVARQLRLQHVALVDLLLGVGKLFGAGRGAGN